ncbi:PREDICTED: uncharacterized protein LOC109342947 isoform X2 [Lupinus angustifolius]|uniref:uncharacterized protein LOC109342947 isoform X2 n=1 Tax=Lupinus angustifolius TaxID=3871 RepID=UPI00092F85A1|nr:PREDICTED: uncharacterized protein LOC109342947 isoform X2 [Lupinus angustifolius]
MKLKLKNHVTSRSFNSNKRQIDAIRVVRDVEIENLVTELHLIRSYFSKEQLQKPLLQVFDETFPNLSIVMSGEEDKIFYVKWKNKENVVVDSLLQILSIDAERRGFLGGVDFEEMVLEEPSETQTLTTQGAPQFPCPGVKHKKLSVGMSSKTFRQPKLGEMLLSVHGSPLCVFKENNMEVIHGLKIV